ncbi:MAG TPA: hypothetical protein VLA48_03130 [Nitrososphaeraceae archaeon]|nr:hypothetical protein [Nitrososphaeraceae archaeon]
MRETVEKKYWIFNATHINCRKLSDKERQQIKEVEKKYYKNEQDGKLIGQ